MAPASTRRQAADAPSSTTSLSARRRLKDSFAAYFHHKDRPNASGPISRWPTEEGDLHLASSRSRSSLDLLSASSSRSRPPSVCGSASGSERGDLSGLEADSATEDSLDLISVATTGSTGRRRRSSGQYPAPPRIGGTTSSPLLRGIGWPANRQAVPLAASRDHQANSRRVFAGEDVDPAERPRSLKGKARSDDSAGSEEEERLSRRGSEGGGLSGANEHEQAVPQRQAPRSRPNPEERVGRAPRASAEDGRGRRREQRTPGSPGHGSPPGASQRLTAAAVGSQGRSLSDSRSRSSSAPATPRPSQLPLLTPLHPIPTDPSISDSLRTPRPAARQPDMWPAPPPPPPPTARPHVVSPPSHDASPLPSDSLPSLATSLPSASPHYRLHRLSGARLVNSQPSAEPVSWPSIRHFVLGSYPWGPTVDSSTPSHGRYSNATVPMARAASANATGSSAPTGPSAYAGTAGGFGPSGVSLAAGGGPQGSGSSTAGSSVGIAPVHAAAGTPLAPGHSGIEIFVDSPDLVLRSITGNEGAGEPATLSGEVQLTLTEATSLKDVSLVLRAVGKVDYHDNTSSGRRHHCDHPLFFHDDSFLPPPADPAHPHSHTLKSGTHRFPFSINLPTTLPASLRTYSGTGIVYYKLKATATRSGGAFGGLLSGGGKWEAKRLLRVARSFESDAMEWMQTLEIDNTWPGKVSYEITLPHKAFAAGTTIPVSLKFTPLMKGVRITSLTTTIKEQSLLSGKGNATHGEARDVMTCRHEFVRSGGASPGPSSAPQPRPHSSGTSSASSGRHHDLSHADVDMLASRLRAVQTGATPRMPASMRSGPSSSTARPEPARTTSSGQGPALGGVGIDAGTMQEIAEDLSLSEDVEAVVDIDIPSWTTPTSVVAPIVVTHKIKWSAYIKNPDGHTSELRCALPIHILAPHLADEARLASSGVRNLLFGPSGALAPNDFQQADLPSYSEHVRDRVALLDTASIYPMPTGFVQAPWAVHVLESTLPTPMHSPPPSRPSSPGPSTRPLGPSAASRSGHQTPAYGSSLHDGHHVAWADSELLRTLDDNATERPPLFRNDSSQSSSRSASAPNSRPGSTPNSRPPSRPASPTLGASSFPSSPVSAIPTAASPEASTSSVPSFFSLHLPKPLRALTPMTRSMSNSTPGQPPASTGSHQASLHARLAGLTSGGSGVAGTSPTHHSTASTSPGDGSRVMPGAYIVDGASGESSGQQSSGQQSGVPSRSASPTHAGLDRDDPMSRVPSYNVASRGPLGGGSVPLSSFVGLPSYEESCPRPLVSPPAPTSASASTTSSAGPPLGRTSSASQH